VFNAIEKIIGNNPPAVGLTNRKVLV